MALRAWGQLYIQSTPPASGPVVIGSLWLDTSTNLLKRCTSLSPYTFVSVEGSGSGSGIPSDTVGALVGTGDAGIDSKYSRGDHVHGDTNRPTDDQKAALAGSDGEPSVTNPFVTDSDPRLDNLGDVIGPGLSTDNGIARYDGTTGVYIQDSEVVIEDSNDIIGKSFVSTRSGSVNRTGGQIDSVELTGGRTITVNREGGYVSSVSDGTRTWTISRDGSNNITGWTVS